VAIFETARFRVDPAKHEELIAVHREVARAIAARFPGLIDVSLARTHDGTWVDEWRWETTEQAETASEAGLSIPETGRYHELIDEVLGFERGEILSSVPRDTAAS
jgi:heme-degrading monooxygenase HmoA